MTMHFNFLKLLDRILVRKRSALSDPYCQFSWSSVDVCRIFYLDVARDNVVSNDVTITSALKFYF